MSVAVPISDRPAHAFGRRWRASVEVPPSGSVLVVGHGEAAAAVARVLGNGASTPAPLEIVDDLDAAALRVQTTPPMAVVVCASAAGPALDDVLSAMAAREWTPPIVVTGCASDDAAVAAVRAGAHEALVGASDGAALRRAIRCAATRQQTSAALRAQAVTDPLTGLPNRLGLRDRLAHAVASARRRADAMAVLFVDLDGFKDVNDRFGHDAGDSVLQEVARRLTARTRDADTVARLGGDEFVVVMEHLDDVRHAATMAAKVLDLVRAPIAVPDATVTLSASIGVAVCPEDGLDGAALLRRADAAMYAVKAAGKQGVRFASTRVHADLDARDRLDAELRHGFVHGELEVHYQPRWHAGDRRVSGCEALLRWRRPERGLVTPAEFLAEAEASGAIVEIGHWVLGEACQQARRLADAGFDLTIAVNLSSRQLADRGLSLDIARRLREARLTAAALQIDVPEAALVDLGPAAHAVLDEIRAVGVPIIVDHFGTGQSSLGSLQTLPISGVKIDGRVVRGGRDGEALTAPALPAAIAAVARHLRLDVIADGVETEAQVQQLRAAGCELMQGYYFGHALPAGELMAYLRWACTAVIGTDRPMRPDALPPVTRPSRPRLVASSDALNMPPAFIAASAKAGRVVAGRFGPSGKS